MPARKTRKVSNSKANAPIKTRKRKDEGAGAGAGAPAASSSKVSYIIAIPSYKRAETLREKTLKLLESYNVPKEKIHVFVANEEEKKTYQATLDPDTYGKLIVAEPGMAAVRNFITGYFPVGTPIVNIDDDIKGFLQFAPGAKRNEKPLADFEKMVQKGFALSKETGFRLWGIYAVPNGFFMKENHTTDLKYVIGAFWGIINPGLDVLKVTIDDKEDYLRSILMYLADGGIVRLNNYAPQTAYYKEPGGMQEERTKNRVTKSAEALHAAYPDLTSLNATKKSGFLELRLKDKREEKIFGKEALKKYKQPVLKKE